ILDSMFDAFSRKISTTEKHIALIFHRFLEKDLEIKINNRKIKSVDPFLKEHPKTTIKDEQIIGTKTSQGAKEKIKMQVFILPYHKDLNERDYEKLGGHDEFDNQGFYIYRNQRLMIYGTWFKIKPKAELSKNARI